MTTEFPEVLQEGEIYVRRGSECGFTVEECREIDRMRSDMHHGEHIGTEDALWFARKILMRFGVQP